MSPSVYPLPLTDLVEVEECARVLLNIAAKCYFEDKVVEFEVAHLNDEEKKCLSWIM
jgi:hypothetical protein